MNVNSASMASMLDASRRRFVQDFRPVRRQEFPELWTRFSDDKFYQANPAASKDPALWSAAQRAAYEPSIVSNYEAVRRGTDMAGRAAKLGAAGLSDAPGSLTFPGGN